MRTLHFILILITYMLSELNQASSYDPLVVRANTQTGAIELPNKAIQLYDRIIYLENGREEKRNLYLCPPQTQSDKVYVVENPDLHLDANYCLMDYSEKISKEDIPTCSSEVRPLFTDRLKEELFSLSEDCGKSSNHRLHHFGFNYCRITTSPLALTPIQPQFLSIYDICFHTNKSKAFWTKHQIQTGFMLKDGGFPSQRLENPYELSTEAFQSKFTLRSKDTFEKQAKEYEKQGPKSLNRMIPQMLVPHEDIAIEVWKKTTTHYLNTAPLWEKLVPVMKSINDGIRRAAITVNLKSYNKKNNTYDNLDIYTKTYSHLSVLKRILSKLHIVQKPFGWNIWCKFVHYPTKNQGIMIFLHNLPENPPTKIKFEIDASQGEQSINQTKTDDDSNKPESLKGKETGNSKTKKFLKERECETTVPCKFEEWLNNQRELGFSPDLFNYAYCCEVNIEKVDELFGIKLNKEITLFNIDDIISDKLVSSYDPLFVFENDSTGEVRLPYKADEIRDGTLIYTEVGQDGQNDLYLCHPQSTVMKTSIANFSQWDDDDYCLMNHSTKSSSYYTPSCFSDIRPLFTDRFKRELRNCGTFTDQKLYQFGFKYCRISTNPITSKQIQSQLLSIYDICFDTYEWKPFWTKHQIRNGFMLQEVELPSQILETELELSTEAFNPLFKNIFKKQADEYEEQGPDPLHRMIPQMLVPQEDIALKVWKKTTAHYLNTAPLWEKLVPVMKSINDGIRKAAIKVNLESYDKKNITDDNLNIYTKTYPHFELEQDLSKLDITQDPFGWNIWCKFVHYPTKNQGIMIFLHNLPDNPPTKMNLEINSSQGEQSINQTRTDGDSNESESLQEKETGNSKTEKLLKERECEITIPCKFEKWLNNQYDQDFSSDLFNYSYCCEVNKIKVEELFGIKLENDIELLSIDDIIANNISQ